MLSPNYHQNESGIWTKIDRLDFSYSDGDKIEDRLFQQLKDCADVSQASDDLQRLIVDWPSEYHFSPLRSNLLSSFRLHQFDNILEIGSGCGAISRQLGEKCPNSNIIALEGSARRAEITKSRCRDLQNIQVCNDSFTYFEHPNTFDLITMIGVLEYSPSFFTGDNPVLNALKHARNFLSENGVLIIAIENQLGLKYFNGAAEDHNGIAFSGINDLYPPSTARTFGRKELQQEIENAGFNRVEFAYPFPDYKMPQLLLREESFKSNAIDLSYLIGQYPARNYAFNVDKIFHEARVWNLLTKNSLVQDLSNSFLAFAFTGDKTLSDLTDEWLAKTYSGRRKKHYLIETVFNHSNESVLVDKISSYPKHMEMRDDSNHPIHHTEQSNYIRGIPYTYTLLTQIPKVNAHEQFIAYLSPWVKWLFAQVITPLEDNPTGRPLVSGKLYDGILSNFMLDDKNTLQIIDQEWELKKHLELGFVFFRGLFREFNDNLEFLEQTDLFANKTIYDSVQAIFNKFQLEFNKEIFTEYLNLEVEFQLEVVSYSSNKDGLLKHLEDFFTTVRIQTSTIGEFITNVGLKGHSLLLQDKALLLQNKETLLWEKKMLVQTLAEREEHIAFLKDKETSSKKTIRDQEIFSASILKSTSWKLTSPLRFLGYLIKGDFEKARMITHQFKLSLTALVKRFFKLIK
ncbi:MAG: hypothetical protein ACI8ZB_001176 [Desulforhopalus sp.]|jgi:hypothetical protein